MGNNMWPFNKDRYWIVEKRKCVKVEGTICHYNTWIDLQFGLKPKVNVSPIFVGDYINLLEGPIKTKEEAVEKLNYWKGIKK